MIGRYSASGVSRWIALAAILVLSGAVHAQSQPVTSQNLDQYPIVKRERCGTHYLLPDGTIRAVITIKPHNYQLPDGSWAPIEEVLQAGGEFAWENMANGLTSQYSAASEDGVTFAGHNQPAVVLRPKRLAGYAKDGSTLKASSAAPAFAQREGEKTVVYSGLYKDIIDEYVLGPDRVKHNMVLYSNALEGFESSEFVAGEYTLEIPAGWRVEERNRKLRLLNEQGECIYELGSVDAFDAAGDVSNGQLTWQLEGTTLHLGMKVETAWLLDPERQWPVHIDPTLTLQPDGTAGKDALLYAGGGNRGTYSDLTFNSGGDCEGIIEFDLSSMPGGATVSAAQFEAWHRANTITGHVVNLYTASAAWVESTIVWTNKPARSATQFASLTFTNGSPNVWRIWTGMASTVSGWLSGGNNGFYIVNTTNSKFVAYLRASDWTTATERPRLVIDYTTGPNITTSVTSLNLGTTPQGTPGSVQNYTVSGFQTTAATTITAPSGVEIKLSTAGSYSGSINISNTGNWGPFTVDARLIGSTPGSVSGNITHASTGITTVNVACSGTVTGPTLTTSVASLNLGSTPLGTAGTAQSYTVTGSGMSNQTVITAPTDVEISETSATAGFGPSITVTTTGNWGPKTIWARIKSTAGIGSISGNITHVSTGANAPNVSVSGTVTGPTLSTSTGSLALGSTYLTYASTAVNYTVSGSVMSNQTVITAPANVEISETSATAGFGPTVTVTTTGSWGPKTIWARIKSNAPAGAISGNITHVSSGATTVNVSVSGTVNAPTITPSVASLNLGLTSAGTASTEVSYTVDGLGTSAQTNLVAPSGVELCLTQTGTYTGTLAITQTPSYSTTVWVRIAASASAGAISGNITHDSTNATQALVSVSGNVLDLQVSPTSLNLGTTQQGFPGTAQTYTLTGAGLSGNTDITAPTGINIALAAGGPFQQTLQLTGATINQVIHVRLDGANLGTWAGNVTNTNQGVTVNVAVTGDVINANNLAVSRNGPNSTTSVNSGDQGPGGNGLVVLDFSVLTATQAWTLTDITFSESGTVDAQTDISFVALYEDSTSAGTQGTFDGPGIDTLATAAAGTSFTGPNGDYVATLTNQSVPVSTTRRFFLVVKLSGTASSSETIQVEVTAANGTGGAGAISGLPTSGSVPALDILPATLAATLNGPMAYTTVNNNSQGAGGNGELICDVTLAANNDSFTVTDMTFTASGTADEQADISFIALYVDNGNGTFDGPGTDTLATASAGTSFNGANGTYTATLSGTAGSIAISTSKRYFLVVKLAGTASPAENFRAALTGVNATSTSGGTVSGMPTAASSALVIDVPILTVNAGPANPADASVESTGAAFTHTLGELRMTASNANFTISGVTLTLGGNGDWVNNITAVSVYQDNGNGSFDAGDTQLFSGAASAGSVTCGFSSNVTITMGSDSDFWVVVDVAATAGGSPSETFNAQIASAADVAQVTTGTVALGTMTPNSSTLSVVLFSVTSFTPVQDGFGGGAAITITGTGFGGTTTCTINGVPCTGTAVVNAGGTQITGLKVPGGSGTNLAIVLTTNNLPPKTLTQTFSYNFTLGGGTVGGGGGGGGGGGCTAATSNGIAMLLALLGALALAAGLRRRTA